MILDNFGGVPCISMATRKIRPPAQTKNIVVIKTPIIPARGCHMGIPDGVACLSSISKGVKVGISDVMVAKLPMGSLTTGKYMNIGNRAGIIVGNVRF